MRGRLERVGRLNRIRRLDRRGWLEKAVRRSRATIRVNAANEGD